MSIARVRDPRGESQYDLLVITSLVCYRGMEDPIKLSCQSIQWHASSLGVNANLAESLATCAT